MRVGRAVGDALSAVCLLVLLLCALLTMPALGAAVIPPAALLWRHRSQAARWELAAHTDPTTGLLNSAGWHRAAERATTGTTVGSVLLLDIDHFKLINDEHGHSAGDAVLAAVAGTVARSVGDGDVAGRIGGDEFAVALPGLTSAAELDQVAERIRSAVARLTVGVAFGMVVLGVTVSIGTATSGDRQPTGPRVLLMAADAALYAAKQAGRNRVRHWGAGNTEPSDLPAG